MDNPPSRLMPGIFVSGSVVHTSTLKRLSLRLQVVYLRQPVHPWCHAVHPGPDHVRYLVVRGSGDPCCCPCWHQRPRDRHRGSSVHVDHRDAVRCSSGHRPGDPDRYAPPGLWPPSEYRWRLSWSIPCHGCAPRWGSKLDFRFHRLCWECRSCSLVLCPEGTSLR